MSNETLLAEGMALWQQLLDEGNPISPEEVCQQLGRPDLGQELTGQINAFRAFDIRMGASVTSWTKSRTIGPYKLLRQIGIGGMGEVWLAEQERPVRRRVALKLIKAGADTKEVVARFEAERQALAMMDHPNIAKVLDAGTSGDGHPYFVMELVMGIPFTVYCDQNKLSIKERLELFVPVCTAVQHAHQKGIIHRDLKPTNILVCLNDGKPVPKIIDFGLAKALQHQSRLTDKTMFTEFGQVVGTLQYMSPEQAEMNQLDIDTRTDIYSLGVILYELLTGSTPLDAVATENLALLKILETIRQRDPPRPSVHLSSSTSEVVTGISIQRKIDPAKLKNILRGDLDWIVMKALEKDRTRRYETANGFAVDVKHFLEHEVVTARPPSLSYRLKKFSRKNRATVIAGLLVGVALLSGIVGTTWGLFRAKYAEEQAEKRLGDAIIARKNEAEQRARAEIQTKEAIESKRLAIEQRELAKRNELSANLLRERAEQEKQIALSVRDFLQHNLLRQVSVWEQATRASLHVNENVARHNITVKELLDNAANEFSPESIGGKFPSQPVVQAEILETIGEAYEATGDYSKSLEFISAGLQLRQEHLGPDDPKSVAGQINLAFANLVASREKEAVALFVESIDQMVILMSPSLGDPLIEAGNAAHVNAGDRAADAMTAALNAIERRSDFRRFSMPVIEFSLVDGAMAFMTLAQTVSKLERLVQLAKDRFGEEDRRTICCEMLLGLSHHGLGQIDTACRIYEEVMNRGELLWQEDDVMLMAIRMILTEAYETRGNQLDKVLVLRQQIHESLVKSLGAVHPATLNSGDGLAESYLLDGQIDKAVSILEKTLELTKASFGNDHPETLGSMNTLAFSFQRAGNWEKALPLLEESFELSKLRLGEDHALTINATANLAFSYQAVGQLDKALPLMETALEKTKARSGPSHNDTLIIMQHLALTCLVSGKYDKALPLLESTLELKQKKQGKDNLESLTFMVNLAAGYRAAGQVSKAQQMSEEMLIQLKAKLKMDDEKTLSYLVDLAARLCAANQVHSLLFFEETILLIEGKLGRQHVNYLAAIASLGVIYRERQKLDKALPLLLEAANASQQVPNLEWIGTELRKTWLQAGRIEEFELLVEEHLTQARINHEPESLPLANILAGISLDLLAIEDFKTAEILLRECLSIREQLQPDDWTTFNSRSMLGEALTGQGDHFEAEPLLIQGYNGLKRSSDSIPEPVRKLRLSEAIDRLITLAKATSNSHDELYWEAERVSILK